MAENKLLLTPENVSLPLAQHVLDIYPTVLEAFYQVKVKGDKKKIALARDDDCWRYEQLPTKIQKRGIEEGLGKDELERLVKWKITHQTNRPFLLPQIRKNDPLEIEACTAAARKILLSPQSSSERAESPTPSVEQVRKALEKVCELKGVGPATGTLILSVFDPMGVPFFEDELYAWLYPASKDKLKYNVKEYFELFGGFQKSLTKDLKKNDQSIKLAEAFEKIAFVIEHWDCVKEKERAAIKLLFTNSDQGETCVDNSHHSSNGEDDDKEAHRHPGRNTPTAPKSSVSPNSIKRKKLEDKEQSTDARRSKRVKTRKQ